MKALITLFTLVVMSLSAHGQAPTAVTKDLSAEAVATAPKADSMGLHNETELGYIVVGGNTKSASFSGKQATWYQWDADLAKFTSRYLNSKAQNQTTGANERTAENWDLTLRWEHSFVPNKFSSYAQVGMMKDNFRGIELGNSYNAGVKYFWLKGSSLTLFSELGLQYLNETLRDAANQEYDLESNFVRVFSQIDYQYNPTTKVGLAVEYLPDTKDGDNYRVNFSPYLTAMLNDTFSIKFSYAGQYRNLPAGRATERLDFQHTTALIAQF